MRRLRTGLRLTEFVTARPLFSSAVLLILGIIAYEHIGVVSGLLFFFLNCIIFVLSVTAFFEKKRRVLLILVVVFLGGCNIMHWQELKYVSSYSLDRYNSAGSLELIALVREETGSLQGNKLLLKPYFVEGNEVKYGYIQIDKRYLPVELKSGDLIRARFFLSRPQDALNPGSFSAYKYLKRKGVYSLGYLDGEIEKLCELDNFFLHSIIKLKYRLIRLVDENAERPYNEFLKALILGERDRLPREWAEDFTLCGVNHLLAISGLHTGYMVLIFLTLLKMFRLPEGIRYTVLSILIIIYIVMTGFRSSIFRAGVLSIAFIWAPFFKRKGDILNILGLTAFLNNLLAPCQVFDTGFQFSYLVLLSIVFWHEILEKLTGPVFSVSIAAFLASFPLTAYYFNLIVPVGIIANSLAIPLAGIIVSGAIISLLSGLINPVFAAVGFKLLGFPVRILIYSIRIMTFIPSGAIETATPSLFRVLFCFFLIFILPFYLKKRIIPLNEARRKRGLIYILSVSLIIISLFNLKAVLRRDLEISFLAVGQGDSIVLSTPGNKHILVDGGGYAGPGSTQGRYTVLPYLKYRGIRTLEIVFISHFDADHAAGILDIIETRKVKVLVFPVNFERNEIAEEIIAKAKRYNIPVLLTREGDCFQLDEVFFRVLNPSADFRGLSSNDNSLVLRVEYRDFSLLLTGDLEKEGENRLLGGELPLQSSVLKFGHHGSNSSSSEKFLKAVSPLEGIISAGKNNYGHPAREILERSSRLGIRLWRTDEAGAVLIRTNGYDYSIEGYLQ